MSPAIRALLRSLALAVLAIAMAACSSPSAPSLSYNQTSAALRQGEQDVEAALTSFEGSRAGQAISAVIDSSAYGAAISLNPASSEASLQSHTGTGDLDSHTYDYDEATSSWTDNGDSMSGNLEYHWQYDVDKLALFEVDWDALQPTTDVKFPDYAETTEVPQGLRATLRADGSVLGSGEASIDYFQSATCGTTPEMVGVSASGYVGETGNKLTFEGAYSLDETGAADTITTTGNLDLVSGAHQAGVDWNVTVQGTNTREGSCYPGFFTPSSGTASVGVYAGSADARLVVSVGTVSTDESTGLTTVDINGSLSLNGHLAVSFAGTIDDEDGDGVPGDNVTLTFAEGETLTLEQFINNEYAVAATSLKVLGLLN